MLKQLVIGSAVFSLAACGGGGGGSSVDPATGLVGDWKCKVRTIVDGRSHTQLFEMRLAEDRKATVISERTYKESGISLKYEQTSVGVWKTGGMRFGLDNLEHSVKLLKASGRVMREMPENRHESFARTKMRDRLQPTPKIRFDIASLTASDLKLLEGEAEDPNPVKTSCSRIVEKPKEEKVEAEAEQKEEVKNTSSALFN